MPKNIVHKEQGLIQLTAADYYSVHVERNKIYPYRRKLAVDCRKFPIDSIIEAEFFPPRAPPTLIIEFLSDFMLNFVYGVYSAHNKKE